MNLTAFETFYEEKRPFFLEGLTIFNYEFDNNSLFYSRRIGHAPTRSIRPAESTFVSTPDKTTILSAVKFSGTTSDGLSVGLIQSLTANEYARISDLNGNITREKIEPLTNYTVARIQKGYKAGNTLLGGMVTSTNRFIEDGDLEFMPGSAITGGLDIRHHWKEKEFFLDAKILGSTVSGSAEAITALQESSARYFQRPGAGHLDYDTTKTRLGGMGAKLKIGKGSKGFWRYSTGVTLLTPGLELNDLGYMKSADKITLENNLSYFVNKPVSIFHTYSIDGEQFNSWNFDGTWLGSGGHLKASTEFRNNWTLSTNLIYFSSAADPGRLRGGPDLLMPNALVTRSSAKTDPSKRVIALFKYSYTKFGNQSGYVSELEPGVSVRPLNSLKIGLNANYSVNHDEIQYVATRNYLSEKRYILGTIDQKTLGLTFRVDFNLTPEFSVQYYGSPFVSRGSYTEYKKITDPLAADFNDRFKECSFTQLTGNNLGFDEDNDLIPDYYIGKPDFNFHQFRSNLVAKWEYRLGSFIYLVWSVDRTGSNDLSRISLRDSYRQLKDVFPKNIFLIKLNYWFSL
jgi:hypothetical protein